MAVAELGKTTTQPAPRQQRINQSYWSLVWWKFRKNRLAVVGAVVVVGFYFVCALCAEFFAPYLLNHTSDFLEAPPQWIR